MRGARIDSGLKREIVREADRMIDEIGRVPGISEVDQFDPRLGRLLKRLEPSARTIGDIAALRGHFSSEKSLELLRALRDQIQVALALSIEAEVLHILVRDLSTARKKRIILAEYFGFDGSPMSTLAEIGRRHRLTRERIRQICAPTKIIRSATPPFAPALDTALAILRKEYPDTIANLESSLQNAGLMRRGANLASVKRVATLLGRGAELQSIFARAGRFDAVRATVAKLLQQHGAVSLDDVLQRCEINVSNPQARALAIEQLKSVECFSWLDEESGWFWFGSARYSTLPRRILKALCVCESLDTRQLMAALSRSRRRSGCLPPKKVVLEICRQMPGVEVHGDRIAATTDLPAEKVFGKDEAVLIALLTRHGPVCRSDVLRELASEAGIRNSSFWAWMRYCPAVTRYGPRVWGLVGADVTSNMVERLAHVSPRRAQNIHGHGWTSEGRVWIAYRRSSFLTESDHITIPNNKVQFVQGRFSLTTRPGGSVVGQVNLCRKHMSGFGRFLRLTRAKKGDYVVVVFDPRKRAATVAFGGQRLVQSFATPTKKVARRQGKAAATHRRPVSDKRSLGSTGARGKNKELSKLPKVR